MESLRTLIRPIQAKDFVQLQSIYCKANNMRFIGTGKSDWVLDELQAKWKKIVFDEVRKTGLQVVILKSSQALIGDCGLLSTQKALTEELELAYLLDEKYWGQGLGTEICKRLIQSAFEDLGTQRVKAGMYKANVASARIVQKLGLQLELEGVSKSGVAFEEYVLLNT